jgi:hypothetical protein
VLVRSLETFRPSLVSDDFKPFWLWDLALKVSKLRPIPSWVKRVDPYFSRILKFIKKLNEASFDGFDSVFLRNEFKDLYEAHSIYKNVTISSPRWLLEAFLISNASFDRIAQLMPIDLEVIEVYAKVFYDVKAALPYRIFVFNALLGPAIRNCPANDPDLSWKLFAYMGGTEVFIRFVDHSGTFDQSQWDLMRNILRDRVLKNAITAALTVKPDQYNAIDLQRLHVEFEESLENAQANKDAKNQIEGGIEGYMKGLLTSIGGIMSNKLTLDHIKVEGRHQESNEIEELEGRLNSYILDGPKEVVKIQ